MTTVSFHLCRSATNPSWSPWRTKSWTGRKEKWHSKTKKSSTFCTRSPWAGINGTSSPSKRTSPTSFLLSLVSMFCSMNMAKSSLYPHSHPPFLPQSTLIPVPFFWYSPWKLTSKWRKTWILEQIDQFFDRVDRSRTADPETSRSILPLQQWKDKV